MLNVPVPEGRRSDRVPEKHAVLNADKKLLENAPGFDKDNWPNMADSAWGTRIYKHHGYTPYWEEVSSDRR